MKTPRHILIVRTDRLGDVLLSLPAIHFVRSFFPGVRITFPVRKEHAATLQPLLAGWNIEPLIFNEEREILPRVLKLEPLEATEAGDEMDPIVCDAALVLYASRELSWDLRHLRIPVRVGRFTLSSSLFLFSHGLFQRRGRAEKSEGEYSLELARKFAALFHRPTVELPKPAIEIPSTESEVAAAVAALAQIGVESPFYVVHPGMGGSALNASVEQYAHWIRQLREWFPQADVVLSSGPAALDRTMTEPLRAEFPDVPVIESQPLEVLREIFRLADGVIAPSTGPLHLAHSVGTKTIGIYSPVRTHRPTRWAPWGGIGRSLVRAPAVECPAVRDCLGAKCKHFPCMATLDLGPTERAFFGGQSEPAEVGREA